MIYYSPMNASIAYRYRGALYLNITNRCPTACEFCIKRGWDMRFRGSDLRLGPQEPSVSDILGAVETERRASPFSEAVFCGYGEPTCRLPELLEVCGELRRLLPGLRLRLNTVGLGDLVNGRPIAPELQGRLDAVRISLNTADPAEWARIMRPLPEYRERGFESVLGFIRDCARRIPDTQATAVERPGADVEACRRLARTLGAGFAPRAYLDAYEER